MRKTLTILTAAMTLSLLLMAPAVPAGAAPPNGVLLDVETIFPDTGPSIGTFTASGPAIAAGLMCESGDVADVSGKAEAFESGRVISIQATKRFTCDDATGDFVVKVQVRIDRNGVNFNWNVVGGTGEYEALHGTGSGVGLFDCGLGCVHDLYDGKVHSD